MPNAMHWVYHCKALHFSTLPAVLRFSYLHRDVQARTKIRDFQQGRELGNLVQNDERMADYTEFYFHICKFHGIYAVGVVLVVGSGVCGKHAF